MTDAAAAPKGRLELTLRALVLGCLLAVIFTAANTYLGLLVGLTFASAIPAAVISMAVLRAFRTSTIWENMTVQTVASVGGAMSSIIFVLPGLVMIGWWLEQPPSTGATSLPTTFSQSLYDVLMHQRNLAWRETLLALPPGRYVVAVGALHLYGEGNLPDMLT